MPRTQVAGMEKRDTMAGAEAARWRSLRSRLEASFQAAQQGWSPPPEVVVNILRQRARALAQEQARHVPGESLSVVTFCLNEETYAVESCYVREVCPLKELTPLPGTLPHVAGMVNRHGKALAVIDLKRLFELPARDATEPRKLVVLREGETELGLVADRLLGVEAIFMTEIQPSLPTLTGLRADDLMGVTNGPIIILDARMILSRVRGAEPVGLAGGDNHEMDSR